MNILSWFGYLSTPEINQLVEKKCHVVLSVDEYYSNEEFLRRWNTQQDDYDLILFANLLYQGMKNAITLPKADLTAVVQNYHPIIKQHYLNGNYPKNVVFFSHSLMGFLWNPKIIKLSKQDNMFSVFQKAGTHQVIIIDDPIEIQNMIRLANNQKKPQLNSKNLKKLIQSSNVTLTNDYNKIYESHNFAFSYTWSGEAIINTQKAKKPYQFLIHPKTSFICTDLLAQIKYTSSATCVAKVLTSQEAMKILQNANYYFSPYGNSNHINQPMFKKIHKKTFEQLSEFSWITSVTLEEFKQLEHQWKTLKLKINTPINNTNEN